MNRVYEALAHPVRRQVLSLLRERPMTAGELAEEFELAKPTMSGHFAVLREAGLVQVRADANRRVYALDPGPLNELDVWLAPYRRLWNEPLDALGRHLDRAATEED